MSVRKTGQRGERERENSIPNPLKGERRPSEFVCLVFCVCVCVCNVGGGGGSRQAHLSSRSLTDRKRRKTTRSSRSTRPTCVQCLWRKGIVSSSEKCIAPDSLFDRDPVRSLVGFDCHPIRPSSRPAPGFQKKEGMKTDE